MMRTIEQRWPGSTIVCAATGPSLAADDLAFVRGKARVICVNDAHRLAPWADVLYSSDRVWWPHYKGVPSFAGLKVGIGSAVGKSNPFSNHPDIVVLKNTGYRGLEVEPSGLRNGRNSGYAAINLAVHLGARQIVLLGYNMGQPGGQAHFFGNHPSGLSQTSDGLFVSFRRHFETLVDPLRDAGVSVVNCTSGTSLGCFPCADLSDVFAAQERRAS